MSGPIKPLNPGRTFNIGSLDHLTQIQHKGNKVEVVDHCLHDEPDDFHIITRVNRKGEIDFDW